MAEHLSVDCLSRIISSTHSYLDLYESLLGLTIDHFPPSTLFWDLIVLTTADVSQKLAFEAQIEAKRKRGEIPLVDFHIIADPPGSKIGNGGSTLWVLKWLAGRKQMPTSNEQRTLIIHAGGQSKRLTTCSALGKIFAPLPTTLCSLNIPFQASTFDVLLALSIPLIPHVPVGGSFILCADTILPLYMEESRSREMILKTSDEIGFFALAHPSSVQIGTGHGVYCLDDNAKAAAIRGSANMVGCRRVLQKPSKENMYNNEAIFNRNASEDRFSSTSGSVDIEASKEADLFVYTDSVFWFDAKTREILLELYEDLAPLDVEIDAYGDFLQAMGTERSGDYTGNLSNITCKGDALSDRISATRNCIFDKLKTSSLSLLIANESLFIHVGTVKEYLHFYTRDEVFRRLLARRGKVESREKIFSRFYSRERSASEKCPGVKGSDAAFPRQIQGCVLSSILESSSLVPTNSVVEYCVINGSLKIGNNSLLSHCKVSVDLLPEGRGLPENLIIHTIAVDLRGSECSLPKDNQAADGKCVGQSEDRNTSLSEVLNLEHFDDGSVVDPGVAYVTVAYPVSEDIKRSVTRLEDFQYFGRKVVWSSTFHGSRILGHDQLDYSFWNCPIFEAKPTMEAAFSRTLGAIFECIDKPSAIITASEDYFSIERAVNCKHVQAMLDFRSHIANDIVMKVGSL